MPELFNNLSEATMSRKELLQRIDTEANRNTLITKVAAIEERRYDVAGVGIKENLLRQITEQKQNNPSETAKWDTIYTTVEKAGITIKFSEQDKKDMHWHAFFGVLQGA
jgi:hypothetical protein